MLHIEQFEALPVFKKFKGFSEHWNIEISKQETLGMHKVLTIWYKDFMFQMNITTYMKSAII